MVESKDPASSQSDLAVAFFRQYIDERADWSPITKNNYSQSVNWFSIRLGEDKPLKAITPAWFESWHRWMIHPDRLAEATANKHCKRIRTLFREAIKARLLESNPGEGYRVGGEVNRGQDREHGAGEAKRGKRAKWHFYQ
ncbi:phage integrase SAM-like domain-containing protein [Stieleria sp. TO1_6]|uniref:phage integrase SAM-like domain-containing protein n=1 Tax=Stieleria tagensis TaxID=2956795 RepID=UPI00209AD501|nr:phage integrase SAM-like domain-containing protein [Stieleria tagensis]MCO8121455.1 phage integrase SAM-like domain-containing protein [Stieleria tagensis]